MSHLVCCGLGYSARAVAVILAARGWRITGSARSPGGVAAIAALGYEAVGFDGAAGPSGDLASSLAKATHLLVSAAPDAGGDPLLRHHQADISGAPHLAGIVYLSTIGVYGEYHGAWIDETAATSTTSTRGRARIAAEAAWLELAATRDVPIAILRLAGIYGPGSSPIDKLRTGTARVVVKPGQVFNRIHVGDIAGATLAVIDHGRPPHTIYNVTDDEPAAPEVVMAYAAGLLGLPPPPSIPLADADLSPMAASFYADCKRVSNARLKADLGYRLAYPTYREGLAQIAASTVG